MSRFVLPLRAVIYILQSHCLYALKKNSLHNLVISEIAYELGWCQNHVPAIENIIITMITISLSWHHVCSCYFWLLAIKCVGPYSCCEQHSLPNFARDSVLCLLFWRGHLSLIAPLIIFFSRAFTAPSNKNTWRLKLQNPTKVIRWNGMLNFFSTLKKSH